MSGEVFSGELGKEVLRKEVLRKGGIRPGGGAGSAVVQGAGAEVEVSGGVGAGVSAIELVKRQIPEKARGMIDGSEDGDKFLANSAGRVLAERSLMDFIPWATVGYSEPWHLRPLIEALDDPVGKGSRYVIHAPPRSGKSDSTIAGLVRLMWLNKKLQVMYASYSASLATSKSRLARDMALRIGIKPNRDRWATSDWWTMDGGRYFATGMFGESVGHGFDCIVIDDPIRGRFEAESATQRNRLWDAFWDNFMTRLEPNGSVFVMMHRWCKDDLAGRLIDEEGWPEIWLPAVAEEGDPYGRVAGTALWEERWPLSALAPIMRKRYSWRSVYQGRPTGRGTEIFAGVAEWGGEYGVPLPDEAGIRGCAGGAGGAGVVLLTAIGIDLASNPKKSGDKSVAIVLSTDGKYIYVREAKLRQVRTPAFIPELTRLQARYPGARMCWHFAGMEKGIGQFLEDKGLRVDMQPARGTKEMRAEPLADEWNAGHVLVPADSIRYPWRDWFVEAVLNFTGVEGGADDPVDAAASAFWELKEILKRRKKRRPWRAKIY